jgi:NTP pyrophosphatase (non-canonical NTP hydrolase)
MVTVLAPVRPPPEVSSPRTVLCGSYRRDIEGLRTAYATLEAAGCEILSPRSLDFVGDRDGFAVTEAELEEEPAAVESRHVDALRAADFVWLHVPGGYLGPSAALEVGIAHTVNVPIYAAQTPADEALAQFVTRVGSPADAARRARDGLRTPAGPLRDLQQYYGRMAALRGFTNESPQDTMLLLTEEVGELARAVRLRVALARADGGHDDPGSELADVQLYVLHLANVIGIDLADAVAAKELVNHARYASAA